MPETDLQPLFNYDALTPQVREMVQEHTGEIRTLARRAAQDIVEIGQRLMEVKAALGHGEFGTWLNREFNWSASAASKFMQVAEQFKSVNFTNLDIAPSALYALASGTTPAPVREEIVERAQAGEPITRKLVTERLEQHRQQFEPEQPALEPVEPLSPPPVVHVTAPQPAPPPVKTASLPLPKRPFTPLPREVEDLELQDGTVIQVPSLPMLPREQELKQRDYGKAAARFDSAASKVLAALTALDVYSMEEVAEIVQSPEGRQLYAPVRVARIKEMLEQLHQKWVGVAEQVRTIDAVPLLDAAKSKKDERTLEMN